jgi:hypothetical protein
LNEAFECCMSVGGAQVRSPLTILRPLLTCTPFIRIPRRPSAVPHQGLTHTRTRVPIHTSNSRLPTAMYTQLRWSS